MVADQLPSDKLFGEEEVVGGIAAVGFVEKILFLFSKSFEFGGDLIGVERFEEADDEELG